MKFIVSSSGLLKQLQSIGGVLGASSPLPILDNFLFEVKDSVLTLSASDLETTLTTQIEVEAKESCKVAIPARLLLDTLKKLPEQPITFSADVKKQSIEISSDYGKYKLAGFDGDEFPKFPVIEKGNTIEIPSPVLSEAINKTIFATGNDDLRPVMSGVFCYLGKDYLTFVATDAHRLVRYRRSDVKSKKDSTMILPKKPLSLIKNALPSDNVKVTIHFNETNAIFSFDNFRLICRLIEGKYPNYEAVIPVDNPNKMTIDRISFLNSIHRVSIFSSKSSHQVRFKIAGSEIHIMAEDPDLNNEAAERLACEYSGDDIEIAFNARFVIDMLSNLEEETINLEMSLPNRAGLITPVDENTKGRDILMLVMPVMIS
ncbi:MAG: DNA polymerase III subunit beta [Bacteroidia bacterium]|nr:DNA polymerase III subunit beta [Bacteroidia bacterium]MCZ2276927.1 DNA polymerase III subunit beta [Bacteroidia bacterium]